MTDYKRFISYMYAYKNGIKTSNIGFAKIEAKNNVCKFVINVKNDRLKDKDWELFLIHRGDKKDTREVNLIGIEKIYIDKGEYVNAFNTDTNNVFNSNISLQNIRGIVLVYDLDNYIGTEWDDNGIDYKELEKCLDIDLSRKEKITEEHKINEKKENTIECNIDKGITNIENKKIEIRPIEKKENNESKKVRNDKLNLKEIGGVNSVEPKPFIKRIFNGFPGMYPFEDDEIIECVKLEPHDLGMFPMDKWALANNSFLLHGYYTYRHLIFARLIRDKQCKYILGVPGIFRDREKFMAKMFGFNSFKGVRNKPIEIGEFGYWYMYFEL